MSALLRGANTSAFDGLYRRHAATVYRYSLAVLGNHADAEDVTQTTFMNAYRALAQGVKPRKAENWLLTIAHNQIRQHFRRTLGKPLEVELDETNARAQTHDEPDEPSVADVLRALQTLSPAQRSAIVMREFEGRPYAEIAEILGLTSSALEALLFRARRALAEQLEESLSCADAEVAVSRKLDGRLGRRENRKLKSHMRSCPTCSRFDQTQRKQRQLLKGLTVIPVPASLFLFRGETAAAAGFGAGAAATSSGVGAVAAGAGASGLAGTGIAAGMATSVAVKVAIVATAAVAVAGGAGYESTKASRTNPPAQSSKAKLDAKLAQTRAGERSRSVQASRAAGLAPGPAPTASDRARAATTAAAARRAAAKERAAAALAQAKAQGSGRPEAAATDRATPHVAPTHPTRPATSGKSAAAKPSTAPTTANAPATGKPTTTPVVPPSPTPATPSTKKARPPQADRDQRDSPANADAGSPATTGRK